MLNTIFKSIVIIVFFVSCYSGALWFILLQRPDVAIDIQLNAGKTTQFYGQPKIEFPTTMQELQELVSVLQSYKREHYNYLLLLFSVAYIYKQTFAIPGSALMNILGGAMFGVWSAIPLVSFLTAVGASCCYMLSNASIAQLLLQWKPEKVAWIQDKVRGTTSEVLLFLVSLRVFPGTPNWFLNMAAPVAGVPLHLFFASVFVGLMPYNSVCVLAGASVSQLQSVTDLWSASSISALLLLALLTYGGSKAMAANNNNSSQSTVRGGMYKRD